MDDELKRQFDAQAGGMGADLLKAYVDTLTAREEKLKNLEGELSEYLIDLKVDEKILRGFLQNLTVAVETLRDVILERKASSKDTVLAVHRMNQTLAKASSYAQAEQVLASCLGPPADASRFKKAHVSPLVEVLVQLVVTGKPETYPVLCLLHTFALFQGPCAQLRRVQIPLILQAMLKGKLEAVTADMAQRILTAMDKHTQA